MLHTLSLHCACCMNSSCTGHSAWIITQCMLHEVSSPGAWCMTLFCTVHHASLFIVLHSAMYKKSKLCHAQVILHESCTGICWLFKSGATLALYTQKFSLLTLIKLACSNAHVCMQAATLNFLMVFLGGAGDTEPERKRESRTYTVMKRHPQKISNDILWRRSWVNWPSFGSSRPVHTSQILCLFSPKQSWQSVTPVRTSQAYTFSG